MKSIIKIVGMGFCTLLAGCTDVEPLGVEVPGGQVDLSAIRAFKSTEHPIVFAWFENWKADGNMDTYLNTLPDSLDVVVLESGYEVLSTLQKIDLSTVQQEKGTKVLISLDLERWVIDYIDKMDTAESDAEADVEDAAKEENREPTQEELDAAIKIAHDKVQATSKLKLDEQVERMAKLVADYGYNGISIRVAGVAESFPRECIQIAIDKLGTKIGGEKNGRKLILEGNISYYAAQFGCFDYLVDTSTSMDGIADVQNLYDKLKSNTGFEANKFVCFLSLANESWSTPFPDLISTLPLTEPRYITLALWMPSDGMAIGGMALKAIERDYERKYYALRRTLQYLNFK